jgi:hypothetical protein
MAYFGRHRPALLMALAAILWAGGGLVVPTAEAQNGKAGRPALRHGKPVSLKETRKIARLRSRPRGVPSEQPRARGRATNRQLQRAISRRDTGLRTSETDRARQGANRRTAPRRDRTLRLRGEGRLGRTAADRRRQLRLR